ncbi:MAG: hypothetical protein RLZ75_3064 [Pseudomonadota bacterium]|jgi:hypothetical protein
MKFKELFEKWSLTGLKINAAFMEMEWKPQDQDKDAAWELYVELITRITTQTLDTNQGDEKAALNSVHSIFSTTREILKHHGRGCVQFSKVAVIVLNQIIRPFTAKWHKVVLENRMNDESAKIFRDELVELQKKLISYAHLLSQIAGVEDITNIEDVTT